MAANGATGQVLDGTSTPIEKRLFTIAADGLVSLVISMGSKAGFFKALDKVGSAAKPATAEDVAKVAKAKPRYVQEWLATMAIAGIIEVDRSGKNFWIPEDHRSALLGIATPTGLPHFGFFLNVFTPMFAGEPFQQVAGIVKAEGPAGMSYSYYSRFHAEMGEMSNNMHRRYFFTDFINSTGMRQALEKGIRVLDIGCGAGYHVLELAKAFPNSRFTGIDFVAGAITDATADAKAQGLSHSCTFITCDATKLPVDWTGHFDLVFNFHALHDQGRPDQSLLETHRVLKSGGSFVMLEWRSTSNVYEDREKMGPGWSWFYACSLLHCLPVGNQCEDAVQLGMVWGEKRGRQMLQEAGFHADDLQIEWPDYFPYNILYKATKK